MAIKDFTKVNLEPVYSHISSVIGDPERPADQEGSQGDKTYKTYSPEETKEALDVRKTQGKRGMKSVRVNMAFDKPVHDYIRTMARAGGMTITDFTNLVFREHMKRNADKYKKASEFVAELDQEIENL